MSDFVLAWSLLYFWNRTRHSVLVVVQLEFLEKIKNGSAVAVAAVDVAAGGVFFEYLSFLEIRYKTKVEK